MHPQAILASETALPERVALTAFHLNCIEVGLHGSVLS